jgi:hypothetical protein
MYTGFKNVENESVKISDYVTCVGDTFQMFQRLLY